MITRTFSVCINAGAGMPPYINVNQYDSGETWVFNLFTETGEKYIPTTGSIVGIKADGMLIANAGEVDQEGRVVIEETEQMTAAAGKATFELLIDGDTHGTANFVVMVEASPAEGGELSESDISLFEGLLEITPSNAGTVGQVLTRTASGSEWSDTGASLTVDSSLSTTSENPVQNKVITTALNGKANSSSLATVATSGSYSDLSNKPNLATVATSGSYNDLSNKPTIPTVVSTVTSGGTNAVNSVAVIAYINSLDASSTEY